VTDAHQAISLAAAYDRVAAHLVGRERELTPMLAAVAAGRDIILEGPPGHEQEHPAASHHRRVGHPAGLRRGQRGPQRGDLLGDRALRGPAFGEVNLPPSTDMRKLQRVGLIRLVSGRGQFSGRPLADIPRARMLILT
jgi:hypothetical protein